MDFFFIPGDSTAEKAAQKYFPKRPGAKLVTADSNDTIRIDAALVTPAGGGPQTTITVRLTGCNIGQGRPMIEKFKSAMTPAGGAIHVIAPLHFDEVDTIKGG